MLNVITLSVVMLSVVVVSVVMLNVVAPLIRPIRKLRRKWSVVNMVIDVYLILVSSLWVRLRSHRLRSHTSQ